MTTRRRRLPGLLCAALLLLGGCAHYHESIDYWRDRGDHSNRREIYEIPLAVMILPVAGIALVMYPFEQDKGRPSFVELGAVMRLLADPTKNVGVIE